MSTYQLANDTTNKLVVEWNKYAPHYRVILDGHIRAYHSEESAIRAAKRLCRKEGLTMSIRLISN